jgi:hypothetical protein
MLSYVFMIALGFYIYSIVPRNALLFIFSLVKSDVLYIGGVMVSVLASRSVDRWFETNKIGICCVGIGIMCPSTKRTISSSHRM